MSYIFTSNQNTSTGAQQVWLLITALVAAGWVVKADSDGTTYAAAGGQVTGFNTGANGLDNLDAWIRVQAPQTSGGAAPQSREFVFQRGAADSRFWRIKYSSAANFTAGAPAALVTPTATDEVVLIGGGTDAAPTFLNWCAYNGTPRRWHIACGQAGEFYSFYAFEVMTGTQLATGCGIFLDVMATGSYPTADVDPAVVYASSGNGSGTEFGENIISADLTSLNNATNPTYTRAWLGPTSQAGIATTLTNNQRVGIATYGTNGPGSSSGVGRNPWNNIEDLLPAYWMRGGSLPLPVGLKGRSTLWLLGSVPKPSMQTIDLVKVKDFVSLGGSNAAGPAYAAYLPWGNVAVEL